MTRASFVTVLFSLSLLLLSLTTTTAHADGGIVLESYTNARPPDAARLVAPLLEELAQHKYQSGDTVARRFDVMARPAVTTGLPADFTAQIDRGYKAWIAGKFDETVAILAPLVETAHANPGVFADDAAPRDGLQKALIALALAHQRSGDPGTAKTTLAELVRAFPDVTVQRAIYGPEAAELFAQVQRDVGASGKGKLAIKVSDDSAQIFVDERPVAVGTASLELAPGEYRVFAKLGRRLSRSHHVIVRANDTATIAIEAGLDLAVRTTPYVGLEVATSAEREAREGTYAVSFAKLVAADSVIVVGIDQVRGRTAVVASLVSMQTGREIRRASVAVDPDPSTERLHALAKFVAGAEPDDSIEVILPARTTTMAATAPGITADRATASIPAQVDHSGAWGGWKWVTGVAGVGALATGGVLVAIDGSCAVAQVPTHPCIDLRATAAPGYAALAGGAVITGLSVYLFVHGHGDSEAPARTAFVTPTHGGVLAGLSTRF